MIENYIKRRARHDAVYWGSPTPRSDGSYQYGAPVEIKCLWSGGFISTPDRDMHEVSVKALVYVFQDLEEQGMLFLGTLADLSTEEKADPRLVDRAYPITQFLKVPSIHIHGEYNRTAVIAPEKAKLAPGIERS